jgi:hypothetical protein
MSKKKVFTARNLEKWTKFTTQINDFTHLEEEKKEEKKEKHTPDGFVNDSFFHVTILCPLNLECLHICQS